MPILITADWHLNDNPRDEYRHAWQAELRRLIIDYGVTVLFVLGDISDEKDRHRAGLVNRVNDHFVQLRALCKVVVVGGNHDYVDPAIPFFSFLNNAGVVSWIIQPLPARRFEHLRDVLFLPHSANPGRDWADLKFGNYDWVFAHQAFTGADLGHGHKMDGGTEPSVVGHAGQVIAGDIHIPQSLNNITYVGAPYTVDFGDDYKPRVLLIDDKGKVRSIPCTGPQKRLIEIRRADDLERSKGINPGDILRVRIDLAELEDRSKWSALAQEVRERGAALGFVVHNVQGVPPSEGRASRAGAAKRGTKLSDDQILERYAKLRQIDAATLKTGRFLMKQEGTR